MYWPYNGDMPGKVASDMAASLMARHSPHSQSRQSELKIGGIWASSVTYPTGGGNSQKVTAFIHGGKIYSVITSYKSKDEYEVLKDLRGIISHWRF